MTKAAPPPRLSAVLIGVAAVAAFCVGCLVGYVAPRWGSEPARSQVEHASVLRPAESSRPAGSPTDCDATIERLRAEIDRLTAELALQRKVLLDMDVEARGERLSWPPEIAPVHAPAEFAERLRRSVANCAPELDVMGVDCGEPPCLGFLRVPSGGFDRSALVDDCPDWRDAYGDAVSTATGSVQCGDQRESYMILGAPSDDLLGASVDEAERRNRSKRFMSRIEDMRESWRCGGE